MGIPRYRGILNGSRSSSIISKQDGGTSGKYLFIWWFSASVADAIDALAAQAETISGVKVIAKKLEGVSRETLRDFADQLRDKHSPIALILGAEIEGKVSLIVAVSKPLVKEKSLHAGNVVKAAATVAGGAGGGRPDMAEAGAKLVEKLDEAIAAGAAELKKQLGV